MSALAAGAFVWSLRQRQIVDVRGKTKPMSRARLASLVGVTESTIWRIETGDQMPGVDVLEKIMNAIDGSVAEFIRLYNDAKRKTREDGEAAAIRWLEAQGMTGDDALDAIIEAARLLKEDPHKLRILRQVAEGLTVPGDEADE